MKHLYISPLEKCNLRCHMCYTRKTEAILTNKQILGFVERYNQVVSLESITFCGGEVFLIKDFITLINQLTPKYYIQIITNATIDKLNEITNPNCVNLIISIDGLEQDHDRNRGKGRFQQCLTLIKRAHKLGFHTEVFSILTKENLKLIDEFEKELEAKLGFKIEATYHPRKPPSYLRNHPTANIQGLKKGFSCITNKQRLEIGKTRKIFPPLDFNCYQVSLMSNGVVYGCCEGFTPIGTIDSPIVEMIKKFKSRVADGCVEPGFRCGL